MCNPLAIGAVLMLGGAVAQKKSNDDREADMRKVQRRETERQDKYYRDAEQSLVKNRDSYTRENVEQKMEMAAGERQAQYDKAAAVAPRANEAPVGAAGGNQVINDAFARALADATGEARSQGVLRSNLASFGDTLNEKAVENNRRTGDIGMYGSFSKGSANVMPLELQHQMTRQRTLGTIGGIMQAFGGAMMGGAGAGAAGAAAGAGAGAAGSGSAVDWSSLFSGTRAANLG